jgi:hypothetical protein
MTNITPHFDSIPVHHFRVCHAAQGLGMPRRGDGRAIFPCCLEQEMIGTNSECADDKCHTPP